MRYRVLIERAEFFEYEADDAWGEDSAVQEALDYASDWKRVDGSLKLGFTVEEVEG